MAGEEIISAEAEAVFDEARLGMCQIRAAALTAR